VHGRATAGLDLRHAKDGTFGWTPWKSVGK